MAQKERLKGPRAHTYIYSSILNLSGFSWNNNICIKEIRVEDMVL